MGATDDLIHNNERYAAAFGKGDLPRKPARPVVVVTCIDARLDVHRMLGLEEGEANVIRNAGGLITDAEIRSLAVSQRLLGTEEVLVIHHTDCGVLDYSDSEFRAELEAETGSRPGWEAEASPDVEQNVRQAVARIAGSPFLPHTNRVRGFVYDVETGRLREVS